MGHSRGGLTTKVVVVATDEDTAVAVDVVPGQAHDAPLLKPMLKATCERLPDVEELVGDKAFGGEPQRQACTDRDVILNVPNKSNCVDPKPFRPESYRERNRIERLFGKAKQFRRFATRYEKLRGMFLGVVHLVFGFIRLRKLNNVNTA